MLETNLIFCQMDLMIKPRGINGYDTIADFITDRYNTRCLTLDYDIYERIDLANLSKKKFGFVLKSLK